MILTKQPNKIRSYKILASVGYSKKGYSVRATKLLISSLERGGYYFSISVSFIFQLN